MAQIRNNFIKSKMNRDLDSRLVPPGEYREALNVSVSKSEGADVGSLENISGNFLLTNFGFTEIDKQNIDVIGYLMDLNNDRIFVFMTNYVDTSADRLSNFAVDSSTCVIGVWNTLTEISSILVEGTFLNFSKTHPIYGVNLIDNNLFFTDNRNQPRKINVQKALAAPANDPYYQREDVVSLVKYYPYNSIEFLEDAVYQLRETAGGPGSGWTIQQNLMIIGGSGTGLTVNVTTVNGDLQINNVGFGYQDGDIVTVDTSRGGIGTGNEYEINTIEITTLQDVTSEFLPDGTTTNPYYNSNWPGDKEYLKEKFVRFSYRFKFEDNEYSLIAPFTQEAFLPRQDGYFIKTVKQFIDPTTGNPDFTVPSTPLNDDIQKAYQSTEVEFFENKVNNIGIIIQAPQDKDFTQLTWAEAAVKYKISEIEIIFKDATETNLKVVDTIEVVDFPSLPKLKFNYQSQKPFRTLPTSALIRVSDQAPVRALAQEVAGNRVVFGNFLDKHTPPLTLNYNVEASKKFEGAGDISRETSNIYKEYYNHTLKQNRNYQVGVVLSDRYGRQSDVILSTVDENSQSSSLKGSTLYHPYKPGGDWDFTGPSVQFSQYPGMIEEDFLFSGPNGFTSNPNFDTWPGDSLKVKFNLPISSIKNNLTGTPGLYTTKNPSGWFSYKIVVKQTETDYYNVYFPGVLNGYIDGESANPLSASVEEPVVHIALYGDNINKIPKDVSLVGPNQNLFRTARPSFKEDPTYYQFTDVNGNLFDVDPYTEEGEAMLKTRDRERDLDSGSVLQNSSVKLLARVINGPTRSPEEQSGIAMGERIRYYSQRYPGTSQDIVTTIGTSIELGLWDASAREPYNEAPVFYNYRSNPFIARINLGEFNSQDFESLAGGSGNNQNYSNEGVTKFGQKGPSPAAGELTFSIVSISAPGVAVNENYPPSGSNVPVQAPNPLQTGQGTGMIVNFTAQTTGVKGVTAIQIIDPGNGWLGPTTSQLLGNANASVTYSGYKITAAGGTNPPATPQTGQVSFSVRVGYNKWGIGGGPGNADNVGAGSRNKDQGMKPIFSCYETIPMQSRLPIFWESTTSGLISELNTNISNGDVTTPLGFSINASGGFNVEILENYKVGSSIFQTGGQELGPIYATTADGVKITFADTTMTLVSVTNGQGTDVTSNYAMLSAPGSAGAGGYEIRTTKTNFYGTNSGTIDIYSFIVDVNARSPTWAADGTYVTTQLDLATWDSPTTTTYPLSNTCPTIGKREVGALTVPPNDPLGPDTGIIPATSNTTGKCTNGIYVVEVPVCTTALCGPQPTYVSSQTPSPTQGEWIVVVSGSGGENPITEVRYNGGNIYGFAVGDKIQFNGSDYGGLGVYEIVLSASDIGDIIVPGVIANILPGAITSGQTEGVCGDLNWEITTGFSSSTQAKTLCNIIGYNGMPTDTLSMSTANNEVGLGLTITPVISNANSEEDQLNIETAIVVQQTQVNQNSGMDNGAYFDVIIIPASQRNNTDGSNGQDLFEYGPFTLTFQLQDPGGCKYNCSADITFAN